MAISKIYQSALKAFPPPPILLMMLSMKLDGTLKVRIKSLKLFQVKICSHPEKVGEECTSTE